MGRSADLVRFKICCTRSSYFLCLHLSVQNTQNISRMHQSPSQYCFHGTVMSGGLRWCDGGLLSWQFPPNAKLCTSQRSDQYVLHCQTMLCCDTSQIWCKQKLRDHGTHGKQNEWVSSRLFMDHWVAGGWNYGSYLGLLIYATQINLACLSNVHQYSWHVVHVQALQTQQSNYRHWTIKWRLTESGISISMISVSEIAKSNEPAYSR